MDKPRSFAPIIAAVLLLLPVLYVTSYLVLVVPEGIPRQGIGVANGVVVSSISHDNHYRLARDQAEWLFWPLEQIDRRLRPSAWQHGRQLRFDRTGERIGVDFGP